MEGLFRFVLESGWNENGNEIKTEARTQKEKQAPFLRKAAHFRAGCHGLLGEELGPHKLGLDGAEAIQSNAF